MKLQKYSIGTGDRFGCQGKAQLRAIIKAKEENLDIAIVWNKSHREHVIIGTTPADVLDEAQNAIRELNWSGNYYVDADHVSLSNIDLFIDSSNFFTLDVADIIGQRASDEEINSFIAKYERLQGKMKIPNLEEPLMVNDDVLRTIAAKYLLAVKEAGRIYRKIEKKKGKGNFITEISMDETSEPQTPIEIFFILAAISEENIPIQTIAPRFYGKFIKGVDFIGSVERFGKEFEMLLAIIQHAVKEFSLLDNLKLSIHSGSDKFSIYSIINRALRKYDAGIHLKTAGTTWLEELIGLAMTGGKGLELVKEIYIKAYNRYDELCLPYAAVIDIDKEKLPHPENVSKWSNNQFSSSLRHDLSCGDYNSNFRQLLHIGYKIAAEMGSRYIEALKTNEEIISRNVSENLYERHVKRLFM